MDFFLDLLISGCIQRTRIIFCACIDSFMAHQYTIQNCMSLFIYDTNLKYMKNKSNIFQSPLAIMNRCQFLIDFFQFDFAHTSENIGKWLMGSHTCVECEPSFIGNNVMDGDGNTGNLIEVLRLSTRDEKYGMIFSAKYAAHRINTSGKKDPVTILHKVNPNPELEKSLTLLHTYIVRLGGYGTRMKLYDNVGK